MNDFDIEDVVASSYAEFAKTTKYSADAIANNQNVSMVFYTNLPEDVKRHIHQSEIGSYLVKLRKDGKLEPVIRPRKEKLVEKMANQQINSLLSGLGGESGKTLRVAAPLLKSIKLPYKLQTPDHHKTLAYSSKEILTKKMAEEICSLPHCNIDRALKRNRLEDHINKFNAGLFHNPSFVVAYNVEEEKLYRINGKHTSYMFSNFDNLFPGKSFPTDLGVDFQFHIVENSLEMSVLWGQYDSARSSRTPQELSGSAKAVHPELDEVSKTASASIISAILWHNYKGEVPKTLTSEQRNNAIHDNVEFVAWAGKFAIAKHLKRAPVIAAMFATWNVARMSSTTFWTWVKNDDHEDKKHPSSRLSSFLKQNGMKSGSKFSKGKAESDLSFHIKCIVAWNAWRAGKPTDLKAYEDHYRKDGKIYRLPKAE